MEVSGATFHRCCSAAQPSKSISRPKTMISWGVGNLKVSRFRDNSHIHYYGSPLRCGGEKRKPKNKNKSKLFSELGFGLDPACGLVDQVKANMITGGEEALLVQLEQLRAQEKELKRMRKQVKAKFSTQGIDCESGSSSSSSESSSSSDSEDCLEVVDTNRLRMEAAQSPAASPPLLLPLPISAPQPISPNDQIAQKFEEKRSCANGAASTSCVSSLTKKRIEVCMGNKCKKSGAEALLQEFDTRVGVEGTVVGCKCMGKCRDGPIVRVFDGSSSVSIAANNSLCIGVNLEDVGAILSNLLGEDQNVGRLVTA